MALDKTHRDARLDELKTKLEEYIKDRREELRIEREFLNMVKENQGFTAVNRATINTDTMKALATVKQLIPLTNIK